MKPCIHILFSILIFFPVQLMALGEDNTQVMLDSTVEVSADQQTIPFKAAGDAKTSFVRVLGVFLLMIVLAYAGIRSLKFLQSDGFVGRGKSSLVKVLESRKLDTRTSIHVISVESERFIVTQNGHGLLVTRLKPSASADEKVTQGV